MRILVVDDEEMKRISLEEDLKGRGYEVVSCPDGESALARLREGPFHVVVADLKMPGVSGLDLLKEVKGGLQPQAEVILITAYGSIPLAVEAMRHGAYDFLTKPFNNERLFPIIERIEKQLCRERNKGKQDVCGKSEDVSDLLVGSSLAMQRVRELVEICAASEANVLICGETGVGKDLAASVIHKLGSRRAHPFVKVSCAVFPRELVSSELYGHEKGAFTGADGPRRGRFELAQGGTIYLDDVDDIPLEEQVKLLRVIEEGVFERVGGTTPVKADVRIIASTKEDLRLKIAEGSFREDLYYRLNVMRIDIPPLRERKEDISLLVRRFLEEIAGTWKVEMDPEVPEILHSHDWPGNVRELRNALRRAYLTGRGVVRAEGLLEEGPAPAAKGTGGGLRETLNRVERDLLQDALRKAGGNKTAAARLLGMKPSTFRDKLKRYGLA